MISSQREPEEIQHCEQRRKPNELQYIHITSVRKNLCCRTEEDSPDDRFLQITFPIHMTAPLFYIGAVNMAIDPLNHHVQRHHILSAFQNNDVRAPFAGFHKLFMHGLYGLQILVYHRFQTSASFLYIPQDTSEDTHIGICVYKHFDVHQGHEVPYFQRSKSLQ